MTSRRSMRIAVVGVVIAAAFTVDQLTKAWAQTFSAATASSSWGSASDSSSCSTPASRSASAATSARRL